MQFSSWRGRLDTIHGYYSLRKHEHEHEHEHVLQLLRKLRQQMSNELTRMSHGEKVLNARAALQEMAQVYSQYQQVSSCSSERAPWARTRNEAGALACAGGRSHSYPGLSSAYLEEQSITRAPRWWIWAAKLRRLYRSEARLRADSSSSACMVCIESREAAHSYPEQEWAHRAAEHAATGG
jgi:hypothetical protein